MSFEIGDIIELDFGKKYIVINDCSIEQKECYLVMDKSNIKKTVIIQKNKDSDEIIIVKEKEKIKNILQHMTKE